VVQESEIAKIYWILLLQTEISLPATIISKWKKAIMSS
jgi:hypothetical protein